MKAELLAPAGGAQSARAALCSGADAVYLGLAEFSARSNAENFDFNALEETARFAHILGAKVYVCLNTLVKDGETQAFFETARNAWNAGADGILVQDIFLGKTLKETYPEMTLHLSTQGGCSNIYTACLAKDYGFSRVVLARETPLAEIKKISDIIETEVFVQGALCSCYSGQCYFSSFAGGNSGNRGKCKQPCRKRYSIDREGFEEYAYALSTSDLCVGESIFELLKAGVCSLKIEGRMRRSEYVAAAVRYYRNLLDAAPADGALSDLKRAYNRGDYTAGLGFGQKGDFLSRKVQGHIGELAGTLTPIHGKYFCKSAARLRRGDGLKILRGGYEVGGALVSETSDGGFFLSSNAKLSAGDEVRITTDSALGEELLRPVVARKIEIEIDIIAGAFPHAVCEGIAVTGEVPAQRAARAPLTAEEVTACFLKTDSLPFAPSIRVRTENAFLQKSALNAFRRAFYEALVNRLSPPRKPLPEILPEAIAKTVQGANTAVITSNRAGAEADIVIYKPKDFSSITPPAGGGEKYLYLPPMLTERDEAQIACELDLFDGVYCEGYYGIYFARKYHKSLFAGAGCNLTNRFAVHGVKTAGAKYFVLSHELSAREQNNLAAEGAFVLSGGVKVMELCYCPFSKSCGTCDKREFYTLTDEAGRRFPLRRYAVGTECRFEIYNCAKLSLPKAKASALYDCTAQNLLKNAETTKGHSERSVL